MAEEKTESLAELKDVLESADAQDDQPSQTQPVYKAEIDSLGRSYATGKRKEAIARVWIKPGQGKIIINKKSKDTYFVRPVLRMMVEQPFKVTQRSGRYDVMATVKGSGLSGQAGALRHGIAKALCLYETELRKPLKEEGLLTRDARVVERKKYGRRKARRRFQFSKR